MKKTLVIISITGLGLTVIPAFLVLNGTLAWESHSALMILGMILWFGSSPFWMGKSSEKD